MEQMKDEGTADITSRFQTKDRCLEKGGMYMRDLYWNNVLRLVPPCLQYTSYHNSLICTRANRKASSLECHLLFQITPIRVIQNSIPMYFLYP